LHIVYDDDFSACTRIHKSLLWGKDVFAKHCTLLQKATAGMQWWEIKKGPAVKSVDPPGRTARVY